MQNRVAYGETREYLPLFEVDMSQLERQVAGAEANGKFLKRQILLQRRILDALVAYRLQEEAL